MSFSTRIICLAAVLGALLTATPAHASDDGAKKYRHLCPPGTEPFGAPPPEGKRLWCRQPTRDGTYRRQGKYTAFHPNGKKRTDGNFERDKAHGIWVNYDRNGQKTSESIYWDGKEIKKTRYDRMGTKIEEDPKEKRKELAAKKKNLTDWQGKHQRKNRQAH